MAKYPAKGVILKYGATADPSSVVTNKAEVGFEDGERELIDSTTHENTVTKSYLDSGLRDTAGIPLRLLLDPADTQHELMRSHWSSGTGGYATLILPDAGAAQWTGPVQVMMWQIEGMTTRGELAVRTRLKFTGTETFTA